ncbi:hypothetical protein PHMEG_0004645 [Phytophthora megakarya]|uniref:M96 mating-specific protein n=1 Tax=Phytophthora megakarya TaxID=4795 RepID=A0A225WTG0_9STRA|nr:hypothetical protein PHMEG_0004645 [Phytophthora megakarya]
MDDVWWTACTGDELLTDDDQSRKQTSYAAGSNKTKKFRRDMLGLLPYSTELQRRKKAELQALQSEEQYLTAQLSHFARSAGNIKLVDSGTHSSVDKDKRKWYIQAMAECEERVRAERQNREMKTLLLQQFKTFQSIRKLLGQSDTLEGMGFVERLQPTADRPFFQLDFSDPILSELASNLERLCLQAEVVLPDTKDALTVAFRTQNKFHDRDCFEMTSTTPLACSAQEAGDILWRFISNKDDEAAEKSFSCIASLLVQDSNDNPLYVEAVSTFRKYQEKSREIIVGSMSWLLPTERLDYEGSYWAIISPSSTDSGHSSTVRFCYRLLVKDVGSQSATRTQEIMNCIGNQVRCYLQLQQDIFLTKASPVLSSWKP